MSNLLRASLWTFLGYQIMCVTNFLFWILFVKFLPLYEIDYLTLSVSFATIIPMVLLLAVEYALLKLIPESPEIVSHAFTFSIIISTFIILVLVTLRILFDIYVISLPLSYFILTLSLIFLNSLSLITLNSLLGLIRSRTFFATVVLGSFTKFLIAFLLIFTVGKSGLFLLLSYNLSILVTLLLSVVLLLKYINYKILILPKAKYIVQIYKISIANAPIKFLKSFLPFFAPLLLSWLGYHRGDIGCLYVCLMLMLGLCYLPESIALMSLPLSVSQKEYFSYKYSIRLSACLSLLLLPPFIISPSSILGIIKPEFASKGLLLTILACNIPFYSINLCVISKWNSKNLYGRLGILGLLQMFSFIIIAVILHIIIGVYGIAFALVISSIVSILYILYYEREAVIRPLYLCICMLLLYLCLYIATYVLSYIVLIIMAYLLTLIIFHTSKLMTIKELMSLVRILISEIFKRR